MKVLGILAVVLIAWVSSSAFLMWGVGVVHAWWPFVPGMPFSVAMKLAGLVGASAFVGQVLKALVESDS